MDKIEINIDTYKTKTKPPKGDIQFGRINNRVARNKQFLSIEEIIHETGENKKAFSRAVMTKDERNNDGFEKQIFLVLDFDEYPDYEKFKEKCKKYDLKFTYTYCSLRNSKGNNKSGEKGKEKGNDKFRAVFVLDNWITDSRIAKVVNNLLLKIFDGSEGNELKADTNCKDLSRMFLGGKKIKDQYPENRISVMDVVRAFHAYFKDIKKGNYVARLETVAKELNIAVIDNKLGIYEASRVSDDLLERNRVEDGNIVMILPDDNTKSRGATKKSNDNKENLPLRVIAKETLMEICSLFKEYVERQRDLSHDEKFHLATNLRLIKGGKSWFMEALPEHYLKWESTWEYIRKNNYIPSNCSDICPYKENCNCTSIYSGIASKVRKLSDSDIYLPLESCQVQLKRCMEEAVNASDNGIYVIKAQTALGKTEAYCNLVQERKDKSFIIAVPTCNLRDEVVARLSAKGVECIKTESICEKIKKLGLSDLETKIQSLYDSGYGKYVVKKIREYKKENYDKLTEYQRQKLNQLTGKKQELERARCIVTTHAYFQMMKLDRVEGYEIIIDEDFLVTLFKRNWSLSLKDIETIIEKKLLSSVNIEKLKQILEMEDQETRKIVFQKPHERSMEKLYERTEEISGPLPMLLESSYIAMDRAHEEIIFCGRIELSPGKKIILSASANEKLYRDVLGGGKRVRFMRVSQAKYKGHVVQYTAHTMSRKCIKAAGVGEVQQKVKEIAGDVPVISFKMMDTDLDIHFGKTEGFDSLKGKDIAIVGTPHNRPTLYKLLGESLGYETVGHITNHRIKRNNYEFKMMTFANECMQNLQLFLIETELEQAIGRARVLREDCTVYVFSNYPCQQAELNMNSYLNITNEDEVEEDVKE